MIVHSHSYCPQLTHTWQKPIVYQWNMSPFCPDLKLVCLPIFTLCDIIIRADQIRDRLLKHPEISCRSNTAKTRFHVHVFFVNDMRRDGLETAGHPSHLTQQHFTTETQTERIKFNCV